MCMRAICYICRYFAGSRATYTGEQTRIQNFLEGIEGGCSIFGVHLLVKEQKSSPIEAHPKSFAGHKNGPQAASWKSRDYIMP
jgi:hypothetical protein